MSLFDDIITSETLTNIRERVISFADAAELKITSWVVGDTGQQIFEAVTQVVYTYSLVVTRITRGFASLDTSTDPGDPDPFDPGNVNLPAAAGFLSNLGRNVHGTERSEETFATGFVGFVNAGIVARTFFPQALVFTWTANTPPTPAPTYRNSADPDIYTNPDGTVTVLAGTTLVIPVTAEERGTRSNTPASSLALTTTLFGCTATNGAAVLAVDREDANVYRERCRQAASRLSFAGPNDALAYLAAKNLDGTPLLNVSGNPVNINRASVSADSSTGSVVAYFASPAGAAAAEDVAAANTNIEVNTYAIADAITYTGLAAAALPVSVVGSARVKNRTGILTTTEVAQLIVDRLTVYSPTLPIGGLDQAGGVGYLYKVDLEGEARVAYLGLYDLVVSIPASAATGIAAGVVPVIHTEASDWTITIT